MSDLYKKAKTGRLTFKGGDVATLESKKKKKKKRKHNKSDDAAVAAADNDPEISATADNDTDIAAAGELGDCTEAEVKEDVYTIDAAKKMKYEEIFPVESKKFGYDPANKSRNAAASKSVEDALDDRVKKKADRYCK